MRAVAGAAALALENERLEVELRARLEALRASRARIVEVGDAERRRLGRDLHDGAQQRLVSLMIDLQLARERWEDEPELRASSSTARSPTRAPPSRSCATSRRASIPPCSPSAGSTPRSSRSPRASPVPVELDVGARRAAARRGRDGGLLRRRRGARRTSPSTPRRRTRRSTVRRANGAAVVEVRDDGVGGADAARRQRPARPRRPRRRARRHARAREPARRGARWCARGSRSRPRRA